MIYNSETVLFSQIKDITEQNNGSENASADVDAGDVKEKEKEKDASAGTWNAWLGNTGMKAAGDIQSSAIQCITMQHNEMQLSIAQCNATQNIQYDT